MLKYIVPVWLTFFASVELSAQTGPTKPTPTPVSKPTSGTKNGEIASSYTDGWKPFFFQGKWGYKNAEGEVTIAPELEFDFCWPYSNGLARVQLSGYYFYIDGSSEVVSEKTYDAARDYSEGLAAVMNYETNKWLYIDISGKIKFYEQFDNAFSFKNGLALVMIGDLFYYIDKSGKKLFDRGFVEAFAFQDDLAYVKEINSKEYIFINKFGKQAFPGSYLHAFGFNNGKAVVALPGDQWCVIDKSGTTTNKLDFELRAEFNGADVSEQMFVAGCARGYDPITKKYFYVDSNFVKKSPDFNYASVFEESGKALVQDLDGQYKFINAGFAPIFNRTFIDGYLWSKDAIWTWVRTSDSLYRGITREGEFIKGAVTEVIYPFQCGYCLTVNNGKYWFINYVGERSIGPCNWAYNFSAPEGLAPVKDENDAVYFVNREGVAVGRTNEWTFIGGFISGFAPVGKAGEAWFVNSDMENAFNTKYESNTAFTKSGYAKVKIGGKWGLIDKNGKIVVPCTYEKKEDCPLKPK